MESNIKSFEDACKDLKIKPSLPGVTNLPEKHQKAITAYYKLVIIAEALNKESNNGKPWEPNWNETSEWKYYPWFEIDADEEHPAGFGFSSADCDGWDAYSFVGSRLCFRTSELAKYAGKQFGNLYKDYFLLPDKVKNR